jgi:hypothetical protein
MERKIRQQLIVILGLCFVLKCPGREIATERTGGWLEVVATISRAMPTGVSVANNRRIFVNFPRWGDNAEYLDSRHREHRIPAGEAGPKLIAVDRNRSPPGSTTSL